jgi:hypothetical protein
MLARHRASSGEAMRRARGRDPSRPCHLAVAVASTRHRGEPNEPEIAACALADVTPAEFAERRRGGYQSLSAAS